MILYTNGCSFTYGDELPNPLYQNWSAVLANKLACNVVNDAEGGQSNTDIIRKTLHYDFDNNYALAIIQWTTMLRPDFKGTLADYYSDVIMLQTFFKSSNIPYLMFNAFDNQKRINKLDEAYNLIDPTYFMGWPTRGIAEWVYGLPHGPKGHPGIEAHKVIAGKVYEEIIRLDLLPV